MSDATALISAFVHGLAAGAMLVLGLSVVRSGLSRDVRVATGLASVSIAAWVAVESGPLWRALGEPTAFYLLSCPVAGLFWLFVLTVFADWKVRARTLVPAILLLVTGALLRLIQGDAFDLLWSARNLFIGALAIHAGVQIVRGWRDDLVERRRRFRALLFTLACLFVLLEVGAGFAFRITRDPTWLVVVVGFPLGGVMLAGLVLAMAALTLTVQPAAFGAPRRSDPPIDARAEAADRQLIDGLNALMAAEAWRREGLTIGDLARELGAPEHRLRRLINQRLGHRNFADFLNGHRIAAAKRRLADPGEARTTVAAIAFDLGLPGRHGRDADRVAAAGAGGLAGTERSRLISKSASAAPSSARSDLPHLASSGQQHEDAQCRPSCPTSRTSGCASWSPP
jgi:AraC-like DNA-binding protein